MKTNFWIIVYIFLSLSLFSQKGIQFGVGINTRLGSAYQTVTDYGEKIDIANLYGLSLNIDYTFNDKFRLKSGLEYKYQNITVNTFVKSYFEYFSIPVILNYNFNVNKKHKLTFGIDAGLTLDKLLAYETIFYDSFIDNNYNGKMTTEIETDGISYQKAFYFNSLMSRIGLNIKKEMGKRGQLNFYIHANLPLAPSLYANINTKKEIIEDDIQVLNESFNNYLDLKSTGLQFGLYYTFGTLAFKY